MPARYRALRPEAMQVYLELVTALLDGVPQAAFEAPAAEAPSSSWAQAHSSDDDEDEGEGEDEKMMLSGPIAGPSRRIEIDAKTRMRLRGLGAPKHVAALLAACGPTTAVRMTLYGALMALYAAWPAARADVLAEVLACAGGVGVGIVRELYRGYVRSSGIGREGEDLWGVLGVSTGDAMEDEDGEGEKEKEKGWIPLLFLTDLYTQALLTMGDDEFFASRAGPGADARAGSGVGSGVERVHRNPLTVDEVVALSRRLMNIAFALYWNEGAVGGGGGEGAEGRAGRGPRGTMVSWGAVREKMTVLLQAVHARE